MRVGVLGGTFNPPHLGHLVCAQEAYLRLRLDQVMLIPVRIPPHKPLEEEPGPQHRLGLCRLAAEDEQWLEASELELVRDGPSYTVDTLQELNSTAPDTELFLILGGDVAVGLPTWREPERVLSLATVAVANREGTTRESIEAAIENLAGGPRTEFFEMPEIGISSTMIRARVGKGLPIKYLVPDRVSAYIEHHGLYRGGAGR